MIAVVFMLGAIVWAPMPVGVKIVGIMFLLLLFRR